MTIINVDTVPALVAVRRASMSLSPRQLFIGLVAEAFISPEEGVAAAATGALPAAVEGAIASLPVGDQIAARITWARMTVVERTDPLVDLLAVTQGQTPEDIDEFFARYAGV